MSYLLFVVLVQQKWDKRILFERTGFLCYDNGTGLFCAKRQYKGQVNENGK